MENQHRLIKGYRDLTEDEIDCINKIKAKAQEVKELITYLEATHRQTGGHQIDMRWLSIGTTDLQKGFMAITRAVACPEGF